MTEIISAVLAALASIICAVIAKQTSVREKKSDLRAERRMKESLLSMRLAKANCDLTVGIAMALKHGKCNGEVEDGLKAVADAFEEYDEFHEKIVAKEVTK